MKILVVTQYFWPENFRINDLLLSLSKKGHEITVFTGEPNYPEGKIFTEYKKNKSYFNFFENIKIIRIPVIPRGKSLFQLFLNYLSFATNLSVMSIFKFRESTFDLIFVYQPSPISVGIPAILIKKVKKIPIIIYTLDLWPESLSSSGTVKSNFILYLVRLLVKWIYRNCDIILVQSKSFKSHIGKYFKNKKSIIYFPSWAEDIFSSSNKSIRKDINDNCLNILFAGNIGIAQDFPNIIKAANELKKLKYKIQWIIIGEGRMLRWCRNEVKRLKLENEFLFKGQLPLENMPAWYEVSDFLFLSLKPGDAYSQVIPGKLQSYMLYGKPILAMIDGESAEIINESNSGLVSPAGDYKKLAENIILASSLSKKALDRYGSNARKYALKNFSKNKIINELEIIMKRLKDV